MSMASKKKKTENHLKQIRVGMGLTITALSKLANVSTKVISQTERMLNSPTQVTKNKILKGLNVEKKMLKDPVLQFNDVFPES